MATHSRPQRSRAEIASPPDTEPEETLPVDHLGLWIWLTGAGILILAHLLGHVVNLFG